MFPVIEFPVDKVENLKSEVSKLVFNILRVNDV